MPKMSEFTVRNAKRGKQKQQSNKTEDVQIPSRMCVQSGKCQVEQEGYIEPFKDTTVENVDGFVTFLVKSYELYIRPK